MLFMGEAKGDRDRVGALMGFATGAALAVAIGTLHVVDRFNTRLASHGLLPGWAGLLIVAATVIIVAAIRPFRRNPYAAIAVFGFAPELMLTSFARTIHADAVIGRYLRGAGILASFLVLLLTVIWFSRQRRELERVVLMQASSFAFFVTVVFAIVAGVAHQFFGAPQLAVTWIGLSGVVLWVFALWFFESRLT